MKLPNGLPHWLMICLTLVDDLSYAKTYYPRSKVTRWINSMAADIYQVIYKNKKEKISRIFDFWKYELPLTFTKYHRILLFTFIAFCLFVAIGAWACMNDEELVSSVLGPGYVATTEENIARGDPFGIYKDDNQFSMFVYIALNNIRVAFLTFIGGFTPHFYWWLYIGLFYVENLMEQWHHAGLFSANVFCTWIGPAIYINHLDTRHY